MKLVKVIKNWDVPDLLRQTPGHKGVWGDIQFTVDDTRDCDYTIVLNYSSREVSVHCPSDHVWVLMQEPPNEYFRFMHKADDFYGRVFTQDVSLTGPRYVMSHPAVPWHLDRDYDYLTSCSVPDKTKHLSWVTSDKCLFDGHRARMRFLDRILPQVEFDLFGRGFGPLDDKWDGLAPYRYSLAIENYQCPHYWTEKLADCYLSWSMPIYYGCPNITDYFPPESLVLIDIDDPEVGKQIQSIAASDLWKKRRDAVAHARRLVLDRYQFFPHVSSLISQYECRLQGRAPVRQHTNIPRQSAPTPPLFTRANRVFKSICWKMMRM